MMGCSLTGLLCLGIYCTLAFLSYYFWNEHNKLIDEYYEEYYDKYYKGDCLAINNRTDIERHCTQADDNDCYIEYTVFCTLSETTLFVVDEIEIAKVQYITDVQDVIQEKCLQNNTYMCYVNTDTNAIQYEKPYDKAEAGKIGEIEKNIYMVSFTFFACTTGAMLVCCVIFRNQIYDEIIYYRYKYAKNVVDEYENRNGIVSNANQITSMEQGTTNNDNNNNNNNNNPNESTRLLIN